MPNSKGTFCVFVNDEVLKKNKQFSNLLVKIQDRLTSNGLSMHIQRHLDLVEQNLSQARYTWFVNQIILYEVQELLADLEVNCQEGTLSADERQLKYILSKVLSFSEIGDCLYILPTLATPASVFGLSGQFIENHNPVKHHVPDLQQIVVPMLETKLRKKCEELYEFVYPCKNQDSLSSKFLKVKSQTLITFVEQKKQGLSEEVASLKQDRIQRDEQFWAHYQKLLESLSSMEILIKDFKLINQTALDDTTVKWLKDKSDALFLKIRLTQLQILCDTYTVETVKALQKIGDFLDSTIKEMEGELSSTSQSLQAYHAIGMEFKLLVEQFTRLQQEIENRKWGLQHLAQ